MLRRLRGMQLRQLLLLFRLLLLRLLLWLRLLLLRLLLRYLRLSSGEASVIVHGACQWGERRSGPSARSGVARRRGRPDAGADSQREHQSARSVALDARSAPAPHDAL